MDDEIRELTDNDFARAMPRKQRERIARGEISSGDDIVALRRFVALTQEQFAVALGISVHTLRNWEQGRRSPVGPALALLRISARHPRVLRENLAMGAGDTVVLKRVAVPAKSELRAMIGKVRSQVRHSGVKPSDVGDAIRRARRGR